ncbi:hypothetical protein RRG08_026248 [Elysia crispata]|uniref:Uncharacterized protein n=1 Tax=Elysia crispata TaxID=231223 RepID=A0AAE0ZC89_9GAST|nr:hypothetical protein RRG08_026248 [Elysia crispata]
MTDDRTGQPLVLNLWCICVCSSDNSNTVTAPDLQLRAQSLAFKTVITVIWAKNLFFTASPNFRSLDGVGSQLLGLPSDADEKHQHADNPVMSPASVDPNLLTPAPIGISNIA